MDHKQVEDDFIMWTRGDLKERAKQMLRKHYWMAFLATFLAGILGGGMPGLSFRFGNWDMHRFNAPYWQGHFWGNPFDDRFFPEFWAVLGVFIAIVSAIALVVATIGTLYRIFVVGPLEVGKRRFFLEAREGRAEIGNLFYSFRAGRYMDAVKAMAWKLLFTFLWALLFVIPGIVKGYAYSMIPYLMADNPGMNYGRAMKLSMEMTRGHKWEIFVLDLSFLGWAILGLLACGVGILFLSPYVNATKAELYVTLRRKALEAGICTAEEVGQAQAIEA